MNKYVDRKLLFINLNEPNIELLFPENTVIIIKTSDRKRSHYYDLGSLCFKRRTEKPHIGSNKKRSFVKVDVSSKEDWRVKLISSFIELIRTTILTKSSRTVDRSLQFFMSFFQTYETQESFQLSWQSFDDFINFYREYSDSLKHQNRLSPNNKYFLAKSTSSLKQREVRRIAAHFFNKSELDIWKIIPSLQRSTYREKPVPAVESSERDAFIKFSFSLFNELTDSILGCDYSPVLLRINIKDQYIEHLYQMPKTNAYLIFVDGYKWPDISLPGWTEPLKERFSNIDSNLKAAVRNRINQAKRYRSWSTPSKSLARAFELAQSSFIACFIAATGLNRSTLIHLKTTDEVPKTTKGMRFSGLKCRAANKIVYPEFGAHFQNTFEKFKRLRAYITNLYGLSDYWFIHPNNIQANLDGDEILRPLKDFICKNKFNIPVLNATQIRKGLAVDFLKLSKGDLIITSQKLGNNVSTTLQNYSQNSDEEQSDELTNFYNELLSSSFPKNANSSDLLTILKTTCPEQETPIGHCSNNQFASPENLKTFQRPKPDCSKPETCLFCKYYSIVPNENDLSKLLGLKEMIQKCRDNFYMTQEHSKNLIPILMRIDEIIKILEINNPKIPNLTKDIEADLRQGFIHPYWEEQYNLIYELFFNDK